MDMASVYTTIKNSKYTLYFNQDQLRKKYEVDDTKGVPMGIDNKTKEVIYYNTKKDTGTYCEM